jgi:chromosomal replication initiation ATPase DnaA
VTAFRLRSFNCMRRLRSREVGMVFVMDGPPQTFLQLQPRIRSRLQGGLIVPLFHPIAKPWP